MEALKHFFWASVNGFGKCGSMKGQSAEFAITMSRTGTATSKSAHRTASPRHRGKNIEWEERDAKNDETINPQQFFRGLKADGGSFDLLEVYARKYFPGRAPDAECLAEAAFLE